jgi:hypothetical protein
VVWRLRYQLNSIDGMVVWDHVQERLNWLWV